MLLIIIIVILSLFWVIDFRTSVLWILKLDYASNPNYIFNLISTLSTIQYWALISTNRMAAIFVHYIFKSCLLNTEISQNVWISHVVETKITQREVLSRVTSSWCDMPFKIRFVLKMYIIHITYTCDLLKDCFLLILLCVGVIVFLLTGLFFQLILWIAIWIPSVILHAIRGFPRFWPLAMLGGFIWCTGNVLCNVQVMYYVKCR